MAAFRITSSAFADGQPIPARHTCDGADTSPPLAFADVPDGTVALALIFDDPDAPSGTWTHWTWWNLPVSAADLAEGTDIAALGALVGQNSWGRNDYGGPCPPSGTHRYRFHAYALGAPLDLPGGAAVAKVRGQLERHALADAVLTGTFQRS